MNSPIHVQLVKWTVPAVALVAALYWYKRRRIDRGEQWNDSGGTAKSNREKAILNDTKKIDNLYDSGVQQENQESSINCCYTRQEEHPTRVPRKVSESMDIPLKNSQSAFCSSSSEIRYADVETICGTDIQLGGNPNASYFEMIATNASSKFNKNVDNVTRIFQNVASEKEHCETEPFEQNYTTDEYNYKEDGQQSEGHSINAQGQEVDERDSANHSPVSVVLDGSVTDEAASEGSNTDSGKGEQLIIIG